MAKRRPLKKVNLALLRKQHADAKRQLEKSQHEYEEAAEALEEGENTSYLAAVRDHGITPEELADLLREFYGKPAENVGGNQETSAAPDISDEKEVTPYE